MPPPVCILHFPGKTGMVSSQTHLAYLASSAIRLSDRVWEPAERSPTGPGTCRKKALNDVSADLNTVEKPNRWIFLTAIEPLGNYILWVLSSMGISLAGYLYRPFWAAVGFYFFRVGPWYQKGIIVGAVWERRSDVAIRTRYSLIAAGRA